MVEKHLNIDDNVACEMAAYIGVSVIAAQRNEASGQTESVILLLSQGGFTAAEINAHMDVAMALALPS